MYSAPPQLFLTKALLVALPSTITALGLQRVHVPIRVEEYACVRGLGGSSGSSEVSMGAGG